MVDKNYAEAELNANVAFRTIITEFKLDATDATHILNGMLNEWQREALFQLTLEHSNRKEVKNDTAE